MYCCLTMDLDIMLTPPSAQHLDCEKSALERDAVFVLLSWHRDMLWEQPSGLGCTK